MKKRKQLPGHQNQEREVLLAFFEFATPIYWGENEYTEYEQLIEPFLNRHVK